MAYGDARAAVKTTRSDLIATGLAPALLLALIVTPILLVGVAEGIAQARIAPYVLVGVWVTIGLAAVQLTLAFVRGVPNLLDTFFWIFMYAAYGVPALMQITTGITPWPVEVSADHMLAAVTITFVAMIAWIAGQSWYKPRKQAVSRPLLRRSVSPRRLWLLLICYLLAFPVLVGQRGGVGMLFASRQDAWAANTIESSGLAAVVLAAIRGVPVVILAAALLYGRLHTYRGVRMLIFISAVLALVTSNPVSNNRYWLVAAITLVLLSAIHLGAWARRWLVIAVTAIALFGFPLLDYFRRSTSGELGSVGVSAMLTGDYDTFKGTAMAVRYVAEYGYSWGTQILGILLFWLPRELWPAKPQDTGSLIVDGLNMSFTQVAGPLWVEGYLAASFVGVAAVMLVVSIIFAKLNRVMQSGANDFAVLTTSFLVGYMLILIRGSVLQAMLTLVFILLLLWFVTPRARADPMSVASASSAASLEASQSSPSTVRSRSVGRQ